MVHGLITVKQPKLVLSWGRFRTSASTLEQEEQCHQKKPKGGYCIALHTQDCSVTSRWDFLTQFLSYTKLMVNATFGSVKKNCVKLAHLKP